MKTRVVLVLLLVACLLALAPPGAQAQAQCPGLTVMDSNTVLVCGRILEVDLTKIANYGRRYVSGLALQITARDSMGNVQKIYNTTTDQIGVFVAANLPANLSYKLTKIKFGQAAISYGGSQGYQRAKDGSRVVFLDSVMVMPNQKNRTRVETLTLSGARVSDNTRSLSTSNMFILNYLLALNPECAWRKVMSGEIDRLEKEHDNNLKKQWEKKQKPR